MIKSVVNFIKWESFAGIILIIMAALALIICNSPYLSLYQQAFETKLTFSYGQLGLSKPLVLWINDGLMAIFFLLVGLEIKRELIEGELNTINKAILPIIAAFGGMIMPAIIYTAFNWGDSFSLRGWAIPAATDIAFALGILSILGNRVPISLKVFLTAIAILDDLGAILIIAIFYTNEVSVALLLISLLIIMLLFYLNRRGIESFVPYALIGLVLWVLVLKSGVHATLAGVVIAFAYPIRSKKNTANSPLRNLENTLHPWVSYLVLPLFAFANAGVSLAGVTLKTLFLPIPLGITAGLFIGKQVGIFVFSWIAIKLGVGRMPTGTNWMQIYGTSIICGIGFTMSLFIGSLAFTGGDETIRHSVMLRLGVLVGSVVSGVFGYLVLYFATKKKS